MVSEDPFFLTVRTVELLSEETLPRGISSSIIAAALLLPLIVLAGDGGTWFFIRFFFSAAAATFRPTTGFFGGEGAIEDVVDIFDLTEAIDGERFGTAALNFPESGVDVLLTTDDDGRFVLGVVIVMEVTEAVDGTLGLEMVIFPIDGPCVLLLLFDMVDDAVDVRRPVSECAVLKVVEASLIVDMDEVGLDAPPPVAGGGRKLVDPL